MYLAYFDGKIHEINSNLAGLLLIVALSIDLAGVLNTVTVGRIKCLTAVALGFIIWLFRAG